MILVDANVLMYAAGREHPFRRESLAFLERVAAGSVPAAIDSETLQEILHRYRSLNRWADGERVFAFARRIFREPIPIDGHVVDLAFTLMRRIDRLKARDAVHAAVVLTHRLQAICSYDQDFDVIPDVQRVQPDSAIAS